MMQFDETEMWTSPTGLAIELQTEQGYQRLVFSEDRRTVSNWFPTTEYEFWRKWLLENGFEPCGGYSNGIDDSEDQKK